MLFPCPLQPFLLPLSAPLTLPLPLPRPPACSKLEERMREMEVTDLQPFLRSRTFADAGFSLSDDGRIIKLARA